MVSRRLFWNFQFGNKGLIFMLDSIIALFMIFIILTVSVFFMSKAEESPVGDLQVSRIGNDVFAVLDYSGGLRDFDTIKIENDLNSMLPDGYEMEFKIECENRVYDSRNSQTFSQESRVSGERIFVNFRLNDSRLNFCIVRYWTWIN